MNVVYKCYAVDTLTGVKLEKKVGELEEKVASLEKEKEADQEPDVPESGTIE